jgi:hypothetical protein
VIKMFSLNSGGRRCNVNADFAAMDHRKFAFETEDLRGINIEIYR